MSAGQKEQTLNISCHRPGYIQVPLAYPSLAAKYSQSSETAACLSLRSQMQLNSLFLFGWPQKHTCRRILPQATCLNLFLLEAEFCLCFFFLCPGVSPPKHCRRRSNTASEMLERIYRLSVFHEVTLKTSEFCLRGNEKRESPPSQYRKCPRQKKTHFRGELAGGLCMYGSLNSFSLF